MTKRELIRFLEKFQLPNPEFHVWTLTFGEHKSKQIGEGIEFKEFRPYEPGEDITNLDPEATLREGEPMVRDNLTEEKMRHAIVLDDSLSLRFYGLRETALVALGCYLLSTTALKDSARVAVLDGSAIPYVSPPLWAADDVLALINELWDRGSPSDNTATTLEGCSRGASRVLALDNTRLLFISDFLFSDAKVVYDDHAKKMKLEGRDIVRRAVGSTYAGGASSTELAFLGVSPDWEIFRQALRGYYSVFDSESGARSLEHFTKRGAKRYVSRMVERERAWRSAARSLGVPMGWIHADRPERISRELEKAFGI